MYVQLTKHINISCNCGSWSIKVGIRGDGRRRDQKIDIFKLHILDQHNSSVFAFFLFFFLFSSHFIRNDGRTDMADQIINSMLRAGLVEL